MPRYPKVALIHDACVPVAHYGGTERVLWWLAKALHQKGLEVMVACRPGSHCPFAAVVEIDFSAPILPQLPKVDLCHFFYPPPEEPHIPYLVTIGGNGQAGEVFLRNTVFVSANHAARHQARCFVYNGIDPDEYIFQPRKDRYLLFLAKAAWRVKNVRGAIRIARKSHQPLRIVGGKSALNWLWALGGVTWEGSLGGEPKARLIAKAQGLLFPVIWHEPFGLAVVEALASGTPVLASPFGSLPELIPSHVGKICQSEWEFQEAVKILPHFRPQDCRDWALEKFHYHKMAQAYLQLYERVLAGEALNPAPPRTIGTPPRFVPIPRQNA